jgi:DNA-directed RNA polymerase subunit beta
MGTRRPYAQVSSVGFAAHLGFGTDDEILALFGESAILNATLGKDICRTREEGLQELYRKLRPGEPVSVEGAETLLNNMFFDPKRYDLGRFGIYKLNKKLALASRLIGHQAAETLVDANGEIIVAEGETITEQIARTIQASSINEVTVHPVVVVGNTVTVMDERIKIIGNNRVDAAEFILAGMDPAYTEGLDVASLGVTERVRIPVLKEILAEAKASKNPAETLRSLLRSRVTDLMPKHLTVEDIVASVSYMIGLTYGIGSTDDIDHLGNRRIRSVGELLQNQIRVGFARMERVVRERMGTTDMLTATPQQLVNTRPVSAAIKEFFGSSQLSQFMDQPNPLAELTHKRQIGRASCRERVFRAV